MSNSGLKVEIATPGPSTPRPSPHFHGVAPPPCVTFQEEETQTHRISSSTGSSSQESLVRRRAHPGRTPSGNQSRHRHHHTHSHRQSQVLIKNFICFNPSFEIFEHIKHVVKNHKLFWDSLCYRV